jgi:methyl-accepting chemotaxis protein
MAASAFLPERLMAVSPSSSSHSSGSFTGPILGVIVLVCIGLIGAAGYLKYELDRAAASLIMSESIPTAEDATEKLRRSLGYGGFVGDAQHYAATHDAASLSDMRDQLKIANDALTRLTDNTSTESRHDLQSIVATFVMVMEKADKSVADPAISFGFPDLVPLYATLPVLDSRIANATTSDRLVAHNKLQKWAMLLTLVSWCSLIIASALAVGIFLALRSRNTVPLRALVQSVKNMASGDIHSSVWGMERLDTIGDLARAIDLARYNFSQLPDMSVLNEQGPVRIRFEGNTRSIFESMMQLITRDSEQVRHLTETLSSAVNKQQESIAVLSSRVEQILHSILQRGHDGNQQIKQVLHDMLGSAQNLKHAQEHAADQLNRIIPYLQDRAKSLTDITHITGKQVVQTLQSLSLTEHNLKTNAAQSETAIRKLSTTADDLGERLFGAVNLLQASGKVLADTTEMTQSRLNEAIARFDPQNSAVMDLTPRVEALISSLDTARQRLEEHLDKQAQTAQSQIELLTTHSSSLVAQATTTSESLLSSFEQLREKEEKFEKAVDQISSQIGTRLDGIGSQLDERTSTVLAHMDTMLSEKQNQLTALADQIGQSIEKLSSIDYPSVDKTPDVDLNNLFVEIKSGFETTARNIAEMRDQLTNMVINVQSQTQPIAATVVQELPALAQTQEQLEQQTQILTELVAALGLLDTHMREIGSSVKDKQTLAG